MFEERREVPRTPSAERATAVVDGGLRRACIITDVSPKGARLGFAADSPLPLRFWLVLTDGRQLRCQRIWQRETVAGVQFEIRPTLWERVAALPRTLRRAAARPRQR